MHSPSSVLTILQKYTEKTCKWPLSFKRKTVLLTAQQFFKQVPSAVLRINFAIKEQKPKS